MNAPGQPAAQPAPPPAQAPWAGARAGALAAAAVLAAALLAGFALFDPARCPAIFRFDQADALWATADAWRLGGLPTYGIVNSLGFKNPPGLEWLLFPAVATSRDPETSIRWLLLLNAAGWALLAGAVARALRAAGARPVAVGAAVAMLDALVCGPANMQLATNLWAQTALIPLGCVLAASLICALRPEAAAGASVGEHRLWRPWWLAVALGMAAAATTIHLAAAASLGVIAVIIAAVARAQGAAFRRSNPVGEPLDAEPRRRWGPRAAFPFVVALLPLLLCVPSALDALNRPAAGEPAADHIVQYRLTEAEPPPLGTRVAVGLQGALPLLAVVPSLGGAEIEMPRRHLSALSLLDSATLALIGAGLVAALLGALPSRRSGWAAVSAALLAMALLPGCITAPLLSRPNATYYSLAIGPLAAMAALGVGRLGAAGAAGAPAQRSGGGWHGPVALAVAIALLAGAGAGTAVVAQGRRSASAFFSDLHIPLGQQRAVAAACQKAGVPASAFVHLSGKWYERSYRYLLRYCGQPVLEPPAGAAAHAHAALDDGILRRAYAARLAWLERHATTRIGEQYLIIRPQQTTADFNQLLDEYYALPKH